MPQIDDQRLWNLQFGVEVSSRYHDWRRTTLGVYVTFVRAVSLVGAVVSLLALFISGAEALVAIGVSSGIIALVTLVDLVFKWDDLARRHTDLYQRFKRLQAQMVLNEPDWAKLLPSWEAEAQMIRVDEPPVFWAIYAICWNQTAARYEMESHYFRRISRAQKWLRLIRQFRPTDFPIDMVPAR